MGDYGIELGFLILGSGILTLGSGILTLGSSFWSDTLDDCLTTGGVGKGFWTGLRKGRSVAIVSFGTLGFFPLTGIGTVLISLCC